MPDLVTCHAVDLPLTHGSGEVSLQQHPGKYVTGVKRNGQLACPGGWTRLVGTNVLIPSLTALLGIYGFEVLTLNMYVRTTTHARSVLSPTQKCPPRIISVAFILLINNRS